MQLFKLELRKCTLLLCRHLKVATFELEPRKGQTVFPLHTYIARTSITYLRNGLVPSRALHTLGKSHPMGLSQRMRTRLNPMEPFLLAVGPANEPTKCALSHQAARCSLLSSCLVPRFSISFCCQDTAVCGIRCWRRSPSKAGYISGQPSKLEHLKSILLPRTSHKVILMCDATLEIALPRLGRFSAGCKFKGL